MTETLSQNRWVLYQLETNGRITRNQALRNRITRLAARIADLKEAGHPIVGSRLKTKKGVDYVYSFAQNV